MNNHFKKHLAKQIKHIEKHNYKAVEIEKDSQVFVIVKSARAKPSAAVK